ncbi:MAG: glutathione S-transferase [bacterium]|nr:glutathione S-transferase [bacterium]
MLTVHHLGVSQSERIVWLCEELEIDYVLKRYDRVPPGRGPAPPEYKALHPLGTAPIITDGDVVLPESGAIMEYIIGRYGAGRLAVAPDAPNFADYLFWFHFANASMLPSQTGAPRDGAEESPRAQFMRARSDRAWTLVEARLGASAHFAGDAFTAADIIMGFNLTTMRAFIPRDLSPYPNILAYLKVMGERPGYRRAMQKGDPQMAPLLT